MKLVSVIPRVCLFKKELKIKETHTERLHQLNSCVLVLVGFGIQNDAYCNGNSDSNKFQLTDNDIALINSNVLMF